MMSNGTERIAIAQGRADDTRHHPAAVVKGAIAAVAEALAVESV